MPDRPVTRDHLPSSRKPVTRKVPICWDPDAAEALEQAGEEATDEQRQAVEAATVTYVFRSIGRKAWNALVDEHPPTDEQQEKHRAEVERLKQTNGNAEAMAGDLDWNGETFPAAALAACCVSHDLNDGRAQELLDECSNAEAAELFVACVAANSASRVVRQGNG